MLTIAFPPSKGGRWMFYLKEVRELAQRSMCKGGMLITKSNSLKSDTQK